MNFEDTILDYMRTKKSPLSNKTIAYNLKSNTDFKINNRNVLNFLKNSDKVRRVEPTEVGSNKNMLNVFTLV